MFRAAAFVLAALVCACTSKVDAPDAQTFRIDGVIDEADDCGGSLPAIDRDVRRCAKLGTIEKLSGIYLQTFEGSSFAIGMRPMTPFHHDLRNTVRLVFDAKTLGKEALPAFRGPSKRYPYDPVLMQIEGRLSLSHSSNPHGIGAERLFIVDKVISAKQLELAELGPRS